MIRNPSSTHPLLFQDKNYCIGELPFLEKLRIVFRLLKNPATVFLEKLKLRRDVLYETKSGIKFKTRAGTTDINEAVVVLSGKEYPSALVDIAHLERPVVIDCGAHIGTFTLFVKNLNGSARVYAIEPLPQNLRLLKENLQLNAIRDVTVIEKALHSTSADLSLYVTDDDFDRASISSTDDLNRRAVKVAATTLADIVNTHALRTIDLLKMDIEGSEYEILRSSFPILFETVRRLIMEYHITEDHPDGREELVNHLTSSGDFCLVYETKNLLGFQNRRFP